MNEDRKNPPAMNAYQVDEGQDKSYYNRIGAAFAHRDKEGYTVQLSSLPVDGKIVLRTPLERLEDRGSGAEPKARDREFER